MIKGEATRAVGRLRAVIFPQSESLVPRALPWVLAAGNPYYDYLFGEAAFSYRTLEGWMKRASSEVSILRGEFLTWDAELAGGFIALNGVELKKARQADAGALWEAFPSAERAALVERMANSANLFPPVADDEYYLSKMGLGAPYGGEDWAARWCNSSWRQEKHGTTPASALMFTRIINLRSVVTWPPGSKC